MFTSLLTVEARVDLAALSVSLTDRNATRCTTSLSGPRSNPWSDGNIGMIGISYFAGTQMEAAVERLPHLKAIMPIAGTFDLYESATHHGLMSSGFLTPFLYMIGMTSGRTNKLWRSKLQCKIFRVPTSMTTST
jgi:X-Pro dipeptidyl-peptidase (S15 family)